MVKSDSNRETFLQILQYIVYLVLKKKIITQITIVDAVNMFGGVSNKFPADN